MNSGIVATKTSADPWLERFLPTSEIWSGAQQCRRCQKWKIRQEFFYGRFSLPYCSACADSLRRRRRREHLSLPSYREMKRVHERALRLRRQCLPNAMQDNVVL